MYLQNDRKKAMKQYLDYECTLIISKEGYVKKKESQANYTKEVGGRIAAAEKDLPEDSEELGAALKDLKTAILGLMPPADESGDENKRATDNDNKQENYDTPEDPSDAKQEHASSMATKVADQ